MSDNKIINESLYLTQVNSGLDAHATYSSTDELENDLKLGYLREGYIVYINSDTDPDKGKYYKVKKTATEDNSSCSYEELMLPLSSSKRYELYSWDSGSDTYYIEPNVLYDIYNLPEDSVNILPKDSSEPETLCKEYHFILRLGSTLPSEINIFDETGIEVVQWINNKTPVYSENKIYEFNIETVKKLGSSQSDYTQYLGLWCVYNKKTSA